MPFAVASTLINKSSGVESFTWDMIRNAEIQAFSDKVEVIENPEFTAKMPDYRPSRVTIELIDGTQLSAETMTNRGDTEDPYDDDELDQKYIDLTGRVWTESISKSVYDHCFNIEQLDNMNELTMHFKGREPISH